MQNFRVLRKFESRGEIQVLINAISIIQLMLLHLATTADTIGWALFINWVEHLYATRSHLKRSNIIAERWAEIALWNFYMEHRAWTNGIARGASLLLLYVAHLRQTIPDITL